MLAPACRRGPNGGALTSSPGAPPFTSSFTSPPVYAKRAPVLAMDFSTITIASCLRSWYFLESTTVSSTRDFY